MIIETSEVVIKSKKKRHSVWKCIQVKGHLIPTGNMTPDENKFIIKKHYNPEWNSMGRPSTYQ